MAKRELSSTLKNLKFMQRALQKQEKTKNVEVVTPNNNFVSSTTTNKKCIVIMEGNPQPGALKGRMSFQSFNPSIDKLNEEAYYSRLARAHASSSEQDKSMSDSPNGVEVDPDVSRASNFSGVDHKRKHPEIQTEAQTPQRAQTSASEEDEGHSLSKSKKGSFQKPKREKLDWNVLRPPKP